MRWRVRERKMGMESVVGGEWDARRKGASSSTHTSGLALAFTPPGPGPEPRGRLSPAKGKLNFVGSLHHALLPLHHTVTPTPCPATTTPPPTPPLHYITITPCTLPHNHLPHNPSNPSLHPLAPSTPTIPEHTHAFSIRSDSARTLCKYAYVFET